MVHVSVPPKAALITVPSIFYAIALGVFAARIYTRCSSKLFALDDVFLIVGTLFAVGLFIDFEVEVANGLGQHMNTLTPHEIYVFLKGSVFLGQLYVFATVFVKISLAWQLIRLKGESLVWRVGLWLMILGNLAVLIGSEILIYIACRPVSALWKPEEAAHAKCISQSVENAWDIVTTVWPMFSDVVFALVPLVFITTMTLQVREKLILGVLMALGLLCSAATIPRFIVVEYAIGERDMSYYVAPSGFWSVLEVPIGICAVSIPPLRSRLGPFVRRLSSWWGSSRKSSSDSSRRRQPVQKMLDIEHIADPSNLANGNGRVEELEEHKSPVEHWKAGDDDIDLEANGSH